MFTWFMHMGIVAKVGFAIGLTGLVISAIAVIIVQPEHLRIQLVRSFRRLGIVLKVAVVCAVVSFALGIVTAVQQQRLAPLMIVVSVQLLFQAELLVRARRREPARG